MNQNSGSATLPRGFRYSDYEAPRTPEPFSQNVGAEIPSPPKPRLRLKRRVVSHFTAPTQQFLASVAAADVPIPSIEEPEPDSQDFDMINIETFPQQFQFQDEKDMLLLRPRGRTLSPPKTPAPPSFVPSLSPQRYPNWSIGSTVSSSVESTPEYESSRPSTSRSTQTSSSLFSRLSQLSDDDHCANFDADPKEKYVLLPNEDIRSNEPVDSKMKLRKAPWTKAMSEHLWSTFALYLQDPKVTPVRMGKSCVPPQGVCLRVAREAKRSWKGSKALAKAANPNETGKSGSSTPTAESSGTFIQWPHTCAATRAQLRELCKLKAASGAKNHKFMSRTPTPFNQALTRHLNRRSTPGCNTPSVFTTQEMSMSLVLSTSDSMQPQGPLAQLTRSSPESPSQPQPPVPMSQILNTFEGEPSFAERAERRRLGSPFGAKSYGPSSSGSLASALGSMPRRQTHTGPRRTLQSPVRLSRSGTQKRRNTLWSSDPRKRPSISSDLWLDPNLNLGPRPDIAPDTEFSSTDSNRRDELFVPRVPPSDLFLTSSVSMPDVSSQFTIPSLPPPRLGSPFSGMNSSFSFPNRLHRGHQGGSVDLGMLARPFSTVQQISESSAPPTRANLTGRLAYIDQRLKELRRREVNRRSESPI
ncbi:hypothetical protein B0T17DRAFT_618817 [Bombardia bombarda]|uniref:Uncharacterized protein n=1 Tax=Bombardia bombarda TaxID=252184 RepID=A0AA39WMX2_9PEZI|nr:hypothetical protein B0T17DRAFT_618817 [Bombardia bombarda]